MKNLKVLKALGPIDAKTVVRDPLLRWTFFFPMLIAALIRWGTPIAADRLMREFAFDLSPYYPLLMAFLLLAPPMMPGMVVGFLLLDQRDDQTLTALRVTPLSLNAYVAYRLGLPMILSLLTTMIIFPIAGLIEIRPDLLFVAALSAAPLAPLYALTLAAFAANKVQGFALAKVLGVALAPPLFAFFAQPPWQWIFGIDPLFWPAKLLWLIDARASGVWACLLLGLLYQLVLLAVLMRRFNKQA